MFERDTEIDVDDFASVLVEEDVVSVAISEAEDVAEDGDGGGAAGVGETGVVPFIGAVELVHEEELHDGVEVRAYCAVLFKAGLAASLLDVRNHFAALVPLQVLGPVKVVRRLYVVCERDGVLNELDHSRGSCERDNLIGADLQIALSGDAGLL